MEIEKSEPI
jgi:hypothetical protein